MRKTSDRRSACQNQLLFIPHKPKTNLVATDFRSYLSIHLVNFFKINFLKNFQIADKSSVRKLRAFYLLLIGEDTK